MTSVRKRKDTPKGAPSVVKEKKQQVAANSGATDAGKLEGSVWQRFCCYMFEPDDASYLAIFRVMWGIIMMDEIHGHIIHDFAKMHSSFYQSVDFQYQFYGLEWTHPMEIWQMKIFLVTMLIAGVFITIGLFYRVSAIFFTLGFIYIFSLDATLYLNHFYLVIVMSVMLCFLPCNVYFAVDTLIWPKMASKTVPKWCLWTIRAELWLVYTFAGLAKMNLDWLRGEPLRHWLIKRVRYPIVGPWLQYEPVIYWFSYSGLIYDLIIGTLLLVPQTFLIGLFGTVFFHMMNKYIFNIGIFPMLMIASTSLFFEPYWARRLIHRIKQLGKRKPAPFTDYVQTSWRKTKIRKLTLKEKLILLMCAAFLLQQALTPLRSYTYPGDVTWHEHGHRYSWRMKLRDKQCDGELYAYEPVSQNWYEVPLTAMLTPRQYGKFTSRPEFIVQAVHYIDRFIKEKRNNVTTEFYSYVSCRVNYRPATLMTNPRVDLAHEEVWKWPYSWITDMPDLTPEQRLELPWNWEWNFNWLTKPWVSNRSKLLAQQKQELKDMEDMMDSFRVDFMNWLVEEKFNNNRALMEKKELKYVNPVEKAKQRQAAAQGLLIH